MQQAISSLHREEEDVSSLAEAIPAGGRDGLVARQGEGLQLGSEQVQSFSTGSKPFHQGVTLPRNKIITKQTLVAHNPELQGSHMHDSVAGLNYATSLEAQAS